MIEGKPFSFQEFDSDQLKKLSNKPLEETNKENNESNEQTVEKEKRSSGLLEMLRKISRVKK